MEWNPESFKHGAEFTSTNEIYLYDKEVLVGDHLLLRDFGPYGIIFMNVCVVITVAMVML
jgi:hypothetical protein